MRLIDVRVMSVLRADTGANAVIYVGNTPGTAAVISDGRHPPKAEVTGSNPVGCASSVAPRPSEEAGSSGGDATFPPGGN